MNPSFSQNSNYLTQNRHLALKLLIWKTFFTESDTFVVAIFGCFMSWSKVVTLKEIPIGKRSPISKFYYSVPSCQRKSSKFSEETSPNRENNIETTICCVIKYSKN